MKKNRENWEDVLNPEIMRERLISISMYITAFELLRETIVENIRSFYADGYDSDGPIVGEEYELHVRSKNRSIVHASLNWLLEHDAIDTDDIRSFDEVRKIRNRVAHELLHAFTKGEDFNVMEAFNPLIALMQKIGIWWVVNVEIPTNPDYEGEEIDEDGIVPGCILSLNLMMEVISGSTVYLEEYRKARTAADERY